jgi:Tfp pilus assembly protein FimT
VGHLRSGRSRESERGFTLAEVAIIIILMGILAAIAIPTWWSVIDSRRVDGAANQFASDLRLAHTRATNQLTEWRVVYTHGSGSYTLERPSDSSTVNRTLEDAQVLGSEVAGAGGVITFTPSGGAIVAGFTDGDSDGEVDVAISTTDGSPQQSVSVNTLTSRVSLD